MIKTHKKSRIVQFHHESNFAKNLLNEEKAEKYIVLQIECVNHEEYDFIAEIVKVEDFIDDKLIEDESSNKKRKWWRYHD